MGLQNTSMLERKRAGYWNITAELCPESLTYVAVANKHEIQSNEHPINDYMRDILFWIQKFRLLYRECDKFKCKKILHPTVTVSTIFWYRFLEADILFWVSWSAEKNNGLFGNSGGGGGCCCGGGGGVLKRIERRWQIQLQIFVQGSEF